MECSAFLASTNTDLATVYNSPALAEDKVFMGHHNLTPGYAVAYGDPRPIRPLVR